MGLLKMSWRHDIKKIAMKGIPNFTFAVKVEDFSKDPPTITITENLDTIPDEMLRWGPLDGKQLLCQEGRVALAEIKKFHLLVLKSQGASMETFREHCRDIFVSIDGVEESRWGKRTFHVTSVRFGPRAIYVWRIYNPLKSVANAKPDVNELVR